MRSLTFHLVVGSDPETPGLYPVNLYRDLLIESDGLKKRILYATLYVEKRTAASIKDGTISAARLLRFLTEMFFEGKMNGSLMQGVSYANDDCL